VELFDERTIPLSQKTNQQKIRSKNDKKKKDKSSLPFFHFFEKKFLSFLIWQGKK